MRRADGWILFAAVFALALLALFFRFDGRWEEIVPLAQLHTLSDGTLEEGGYLIDINLADAELFSTLPGIGEELARRIVEHRDQNGPFRSIDALTDVSGIGEGRLAAMRDYIAVREKNF